MHVYSCTFYNWSCSVRLEYGPIWKKNHTSVEWHTMWHLTSKPLRRPAVVLGTGCDLKGITRHAKSRFVPGDLWLLSDINQSWPPIYMYMYTYICLKEAAAHYHAHCRIYNRCIHRMYFDWSMGLFEEQGMALKWDKSTKMHKPGYETTSQPPSVRTPTAAI